MVSLSVFHFELDINFSLIYSYLYTGTGALSCLDCPLGTSGSNTKAVTCDPCPAGMSNVSMACVQTNF